MSEHIYLQENKGRLRELAEKHLWCDAGGLTVIRTAILVSFFLKVIGIFYRDWSFAPGLRIFVVIGPLV